MNGVHVVFNEPEVEVMAQNNGKIDRITDGNQPLGRPLCDDETQNIKRLQGATKKKHNTKRGDKKSRCVKVSHQENISIARIRTGGSFASVNMNATHNGHGNNMLQLGEIRTVSAKLVKLRV